MKFFFPDSQDQIDPGFDFDTEEHPVLRVRQRDDLYAHEAIDGHVIDGLLVSKAIVDRTADGTGKYTVAQRNRLYRVGVRHFFRLDRVPGPPIETMGDCGAFSYRFEEIPPVTPDQVIDFYDACGFDLGISVDHVIFGFDPGADTDPDHPQAEQWRSRQEITLDLAATFLARCKARKTRFQPLGVAQGWSPASYAEAVRSLQKIGYTRIALGGMVPLKTGEILACLREIATARDPYTQLHLLGVTRHSNISEFTFYGITSFDSTSAFRQAFKDDKDNYHTVDRTYTAIRVPQVDGMPSLKKRILSGKVDPGAAIQTERECLQALQQYDAGEVGIRRVTDALWRYNEIVGLEDSGKDYSEILTDAPWRSCPCSICTKAGINVVLFRGSERNKRRGFHNIYVLRKRLDRELDARSPA